MSIEISVHFCDDFTSTDKTWCIIVSKITVDKTGDN